MLDTTLKNKHPPCHLNIDQCPNNEHDSHHHVNSLFSHLLSFKWAKIGNVNTCRYYCMPLMNIISHLPWLFLNCSLVVISI